MYEELEYKNLRDITGHLRDIREVPATASINLIYAPVTFNLTSVQINYTNILVNNIQNILPEKERFSEVFQPVLNDDKSPFGEIFSTKELKEFETNILKGSEVSQKMCRTLFNKDFKLPHKTKCHRMARKENIPTYVRILRTIGNNNKKINANEISNISNIPALLCRSKLIRMRKKGLIDRSGIRGNFKYELAEHGRNRLNWYLCQTKKN